MSAEIQQPLNFNPRKGQSDRILEYMRAGNKITPLEALDLFGCLRLGGRIFELKEEGHNVLDEWVVLPNKKRVKRYWIER
jgi:hypothetical protein